jgi:hypothetical protein
MEMIQALKHIMDEHQQIRTHMRLVGESLNDREAVDGLEKAKFNVLSNFSQPLSLKVEGALKTLVALREGVKHHYDFEEAELPPIFGEVLMEATKIQHKELLEEIESAISTLDRTKVEGITTDQRIIEESLMNALLERMLRNKGQHMSREEAMIEMAKVSLETRGRILGI